MIASMMMYARPELAQAHARLWVLIRAELGARGIDAPEHLSQSAEEFTVWQDSALVLSQTCGMPYRTRLSDRVNLVGTPDYGLAGCPPGYYRSAIVVRRDDARARLLDYAEARLAFNMGHSQSGFAALYNHTAPLGFWFANRTQSGGHLESARMVAQGDADIAALDAQTWRLLRRYEAWAEQLRVLEYTVPTPGLPLITGPSHDPSVIRAAVNTAFGAVNARDADCLDLRGLTSIPKEAYLAVPTPPVSAYDSSALRKHTM